jgi:pyrroloquinoline quinone biosynthesis protein B
LVNASSDLSVQIQRFSKLNPLPHSFRNTPIRGVLLTNADLDHLLGLFCLREGTGFQIYATSAVRSVAEQVLGVETILACFCSPQWREPSFKDFVPLTEDPGLEPELLYRAIELPGKPPPFVRNSVPLPSEGHSIAYQFQDRRTNKRLLVAPDVAAMTPPLQQALHTSDGILFDGTFWSADELATVRPGAKQAGEMGHLPVNGGSLPALSALAASKKIYIHINNTNPILDPKSAERAAVERAGIQVGADGMDFEL